MLKVNVHWLRKNLSTCSLDQLTQPVRNDQWLSQCLVMKLIDTIQKGEAGNESLIRERHALEQLGVILFSLIDRPFSDFNNQILVLFCNLEEADGFFGRLFSLLYKVSVQTRKDVIGDSRQYFQLLSMYSLLLLSCGCENLERNHIVDHFVVNHTMICQLLDHMMIQQGHVALQEVSVSLLALLLNHQKHEAKNMFAHHLSVMSTNTIHMFCFSLLAVVSDINDLLDRCCRGSIRDHSHDGLASFMESTSEIVISWGSQLSSTLGAWMIGVPAAEDPIHNPTFINKTPELTKGVYCGENIWLRVRFVLLALYELVSNNKYRDSWLDVIVQHDVPPWASDGHSSQQLPVACPNLVLQMMQLSSFGFHCGDSSFEQVSLIILQCMAEHPMMSRLLFAQNLENSKDIQELRLFRRDSHGDMLLERNGQTSLIDSLYQQCGSCIASSTSRTLGVLHRLAVRDSKSHQVAWDCCFQVIKSGDKGTSSQVVILLELLFQRGPTSKMILDMLLMNKEFEKWNDSPNLKLLTSKISDIYFHFASCAMMLEAGNDHQVVLNKITDSLSRLSMKPQDRLHQGYQRYVETNDDNKMVRFCIRQLIENTKSIMPLEKLVKL